MAASLLPNSRDQNANNALHTHHRAPEIARASMASVSSLDKDLRNMRLSKYTPKAANEVRDWIEEVLGERLPSSDLLEGLKDGVALCKLVMAY